MCSVFGAETRDLDAGSCGYFGGVMTPTLLTLSIMISQKKKMVFGRMDFLMNVALCFSKLFTTCWRGV